MDIALNITTITAHTNHTVTEITDLVDATTVFMIAATTAIAREVDPAKAKFTLSLFRVSTD